MKVVYSIGAKFGGDGIGSIAFHAASGIYRDGSLARLLVTSDAQDLIPASLIRHWGIGGRGLKFLAAKEPSGAFDYFANWLFDQWVALQLPRGDVFHGWTGVSLQSLRAAKRRGMVAVLERASSHPKTQMELMREEYARWSIPFQFPLWNYRRQLAEIVECDYVVVPSVFARESMVANGTRADKLVEIPFGVDLRRLTAPSDSRHPFRVIFVGQVSLRKGAPYLLEAWRRLNWNDAELWLVGTVMRDLAAIQQRWSTLPGVHWLGFSRDPAPFFHQSDLFVFPTIEEGSALVTYEAMACGLPVITTLNAGSMVSDGVEGFIVPLRDVDALCDRMQQLRDDAKLRKQMGQAARAKAEQFSWERYGERLVEAYRRMISC